MSSSMTGRRWIGRLSKFFRRSNSSGACLARISIISTSLVISPPSNMNARATSNPSAGFKTAQTGEVVDRALNNRLYICGEFPRCPPSSNSSNVAPRVGACASMRTFKLHHSSLERGALFFEDPAYFERIPLVSLSFIKIRSENLL